MALSHQAGNQRDANEPDIIAGLERLGCSVFQLDRPCDLIVGWRGFNFLLEVKMAGKPLSKSQSKFYKLWRGQYARVIDLAEALDAIGAN